MDVDRPIQGAINHCTHTLLHTPTLLSCDSLSEWVGQQKSKLVLCHLSCLGVSKNRGTLKWWVSTPQKVTEVQQLREMNMALCQATKTNKSDAPYLSPGTPVGDP